MIYYDRMTLYRTRQNALKTLQNCHMLCIFWFKLSPTGTSGEIALALGDKPVMKLERVNSDNRGHEFTVKRRKNK